MSSFMCKDSYLVMDSSYIHKSHPMIRKIEGRRYRVMYLPSHFPKLNTIENFRAMYCKKKKKE